MAGKRYRPTPLTVLRCLVLVLEDLDFSKRLTDKDKDRIFAFITLARKIGLYESSTRHRKT